MTLFRTVILLPKVYLLLLLLQLCVCLAAQETSLEKVSVSELLVEQLVENDFYNISISDATTALAISFENRKYRFDQDAMWKAIEIVLPLISDKYYYVHFEQKYRGIKMLNLTLSVADYELWKEKKITTEELCYKIELNNKSPFHKELKMASNRSSTNYTMELIIEPQFRLGLGERIDPVRHQFNLLPAVHLHLWTGAKIIAQGIIPISTELDFPEEEFNRPGILALSQLIRLSPSSFAALSVGYFSRYRYGTTLEIGKYFFDGRISILGKVGYTGYASYPKRLGYEKPEKGWQASRMNYLDYQMAVQYRIPKWNLTAELEYGRVMFGKEILKVSLTRLFKQTEIGFFGYKTNDGRNYGFHVNIPLFPKKYLTKKWITIKPSKYINYNYSGTQHYASIYKNGNEFKSLFRDFNPAFYKAALNPNNY